MVEVVVELELEPGESPRLMLVFLSVAWRVRLEVWGM